ncbi:MAG: hypothetical protein ACYCU7_18620 [Acidimicrobiales bacterium]
MTPDDLAEVLRLRGMLWPALRFTTRQDAADDGKLWLRMLGGYRLDDVCDALDALACDPAHRVYAPDVRHVMQAVTRQASTRRATESREGPRSPFGVVATRTRSLDALRAARAALMGSGTKEADDGV